MLRIPRAISICAGLLFSLLAACGGDGDEGAPSSAAAGGAGAGTGGAAAGSGGSSGASGGSGAGGATAGAGGSAGGAAGSSGGSAGGAAGSSAGGSSGGTGGASAGAGGSAAGAGGATGGTAGAAGASGAAAGQAGAGGAAATACGAHTFVASCKLAAGPCTDYYGKAFTTAAIKSVCPSPNTYSDAPCDSTGTVGSCEQTGPGPDRCARVWGFPPQDTATVKVGCMGTNQTFHAP